MRSVMVTFNNNYNSKEYEYLCLSPHVQVGDYCLVYSQGRPATVLVTNVKAEANPSKATKPILEILNTEDIQARAEELEEKVRLIAKTEREIQLETKRLQEKEYMQFLAEKHPELKDKIDYLNTLTGE